MSFDDQELRRRLAALAGQASAPRLTIDGVARRVRRRRRRIVGGACGSFLALTALAVTVPLAVTNSGPPTGHPAVLTFRPSVRVRVMSRHQSVPVARRLPQPLFAVSPGEHLVIRVRVTVPRHHSLTALWLGITGDVWGSGPGGRPIDMNPILAHTRRPLPPGPHRFRFVWTVPAALLAGTHRWLTMSWTFRDGGATGGIAEFGVPPLPRPPRPVPPPSPRGATPSPR